MSFCRALSSSFSSLLSSSSARVSSSSSFRSPLSSLFPRLPLVLTTPLSFTPTRLYVHHVETDGEMRKLIENAGQRLVIVDWSATWCGPCRAIAPLYEKLSDDYGEKNGNVLFIKADIDQLPAAAEEAGVQSVPTFHAIKNKQVVAEFSGADQKRLKEMVEKHK